MLVHVKLFATLRRYVPEAAPGKPTMIDLPEGATLQDLVDRLGIPTDETKVAFVNGRAQEMDFTLNSGDEVGIFPPIGGG